MLVKKEALASVRSKKFLHREGRSQSALPWCATASAGGNKEMMSTSLSTGEGRGWTVCVLSVQEVQVVCNLAERTLIKAARDFANIFSWRGRTPNEASVSQKITRPLPAHAL